MLTCELLLNMQLCYVLLALIVLVMWRRALGVTVGAGQILLHTLIVSNCCCRDSFGHMLPATGLDFQWMDKNKKENINHINNTLEYCSIINEYYKGTN